MNSVFFSVVFFAAGSGQLVEARSAERKLMAVREREEALAATQPAGSADGLDNGNQAESRPVRESGK